MSPGEMLLEDISDHIPNRGMILVARDGTTLSSRFPEEASYETFAIMSATMLGAALTACREVGIDKLKRLVIEGGGGKVYIYPAGKRNIMAIAVDSMDQTSESYLLESLEKLGSV